MDPSSPEPASTYIQIRQRIFSLTPAELGLFPSKTTPHLWGVLMERGYEAGIASLVSFADGTTSLYYSTGGGLVGNPEYKPLAEASKALVSSAEQCLSLMSPAVDFPLPGVDQVRFFLLSFTGVYTAEAPEKSLASGSHPLSQLHGLANETLAQLSTLIQKKPR